MECDECVVLVVGIKAHLIVVAHIGDPIFKCIVESVAAFCKTLAVAVTVPLHSQNSVLYADPVTRKPVSKTSELAEIQAFALLDYRQKLGGFADVITPHLDELWEECATILANGRVHMRADMMSVVLHDFGEASNRDEDVELLRFLWAWYSDDWSTGVGVFSYGMTSFHTVWEEMCRSAMQGFGVPADHIAVASQPKYQLDGSELSLAAQRPDILRMAEGAKLLLADAKWYSIDEKSLPGTPDVIKQFNYQISVDPAFPVLINCLLFPSEGASEWADVGLLQMHFDGKPDPRFPTVRLVSLEWRRLAELYIARETLPSDFYSWLIALDGEAVG